VHQRRYTDLYARLRTVAANPTNAVAAVKLSLRSYTASEMGARDLISTVWNILDQDLDNTASVINIIIDLVEDEDKSSSLLSAWNGFKIEVRVYCFYDIFITNFSLICLATSSIP
jgi:E3 ubiquitin-protein ligase ZNF598